MKLYAVVIGRKGRHTRFVAYHPEYQPGQPALAVYETRKEARTARQKILRDHNLNNDVHVVVFRGPKT